jgi:hypothetical protein
MLEIGQFSEFFHIELGPIKPFLDILGISICIRKQIFELNLIKFFALALVENLASAVDSFCAVFAGHVPPPP